jgi:hypothetical protein
MTSVTRYTSWRKGIAIRARLPMYSRHKCLEFLFMTIFGAHLKRQVGAVGQYPGILVAVNTCNQSMCAIQKERALHIEFGASLRLIAHRV